MHVLQREQSDLFFHAARLNAIFSILCGLTMALGASTVADWLGLDKSTDVMVIGIVLILFAIRLSMIQRTGLVSRVEAWSIVIGDLGWVAFSLVLLIGHAGSFSVLGLFLIATTAVAVMGFGLAQAVGLHRTRILSRQT